MVLDEYQRYFDGQVRIRRYPYRVEASLRDGLLMFRGQFADYPPGPFTFESRGALTDEQFSAKDRELTTKGFALLSRQRIEANGRVYIQATWTKRS